MTQLSRQIRTSVKQGGGFPAVVVDVFYGKASVRLAANGAIMRNLKVVGGPVVAGQTVEVDFTTPEPRVLAVSQEGLTKEDVLDLLNRRPQVSKTSSFTWQILTFSGGTMTGVYSSDNVGLADALADAPSGGTVLIPSCEISGIFTVPACVELRGISMKNSIIEGDITLESGAAISEITVLGTVTGPNSNFANIRSSRVYKEIGAAVFALSGCRLSIRESLIQSGDTYCIDSAGDARIYNSRVWAGAWDAANWFNGTVVTYCVTEFPPEDCIPVADDPEIRSLWSTGSVSTAGPSVRAVELTTPARDASAIDGTATSLLLSQTTGATHKGKPWSILRSGKYLYLQVITTESDNAGMCVLGEYDTEEDSWTYVNAVEAATVDSYFGDLSICYIEDRKVLLHVADDEASAVRGVYVVDFSAGTSTLELSARYPWDVFSQKRSNGDIWLYVLGDETTHDYIMCKNWTVSGEWTEIELSGTWFESNVSFIGEDYLVLVHGSSTTPPLGTRAAVVDLSDNSVTISSVQAPASGASINAYTNSSAPDNTNGKLYYEAHGYESAVPGFQNYWYQLIELDPATAGLTVINSATALSVYTAYILLSTREKAYALRYPTGKLYEASTFTELATFATSLTGVAALMDDNGPSVWWLNYATETIYQTKIDGTVMNSFAFDRPNTNYYSLLHAADSLIFICIENTTNAYKHYWIR
jgi:hypothetical protein